MTVEMYSPKDPGETITYAMDFVNVLATGETISSASVGISVYRGTDASSASVLSGASSISGSQIRQVCTLGVDGVIYRLRFVASTSSARFLVAGGYLPVNAV